MLGMRQVIVVLVAATMALVSGCGQTPVGEESSMSRVKIYESIGEMAKDSQRVIVGRVDKQEVVEDITPDTQFTLSTVEVLDPIKGLSKAAVGEQVVVRQFGSEDQLAPVPIMVVGTVYLLFLTKSGLDGERAAHYYVTGSNAGIYEADSTEAGRSGAWDSVTFAQVQKEEGEDLPPQIRGNEVPR